MRSAVAEVTGVRTCVSGTGCKEYDWAQGSPALLVEPGSVLCLACARVAERDVRALPSDYVALEQLVPPSLGEWSDGQPRRGRGEMPLPLREHMLVLQRHIWWVLTAWEPVVRELDRLSDEVRAGVREGWAVQRAADVVAPRVGLLARVGPTDMADYPAVDDSVDSAVVCGPGRARGFMCHSAPTGLDGVAHLRRLHRLANSVTGLTERVRRLPGACHECLREGVLRQHHPQHFKHDPPVWCSECGAWRPSDEYERMMRLIVWQGAD